MSAYTGHYVVYGNRILHPTSIYEVNETYKLQFMWRPRKCAGSGKSLWFTRAYFVEKTDGWLIREHRWYSQLEFLKYRLTQ